MKTRKLEYFEDQLKASALGQEVLQVLRTHANEAMYLVNKNRPTMVCWQRHYGPHFIKSVVDSGFEEEVNFIKEVKGISMETLILNMAEVMTDNGTPELKRAIGNFAPQVLYMARNTHNLREIMALIKNGKPTQQHG